MKEGGLPLPPAFQYSYDIKSFTDRNFVDNFLQVEIYLALVANI